MMLVATSDATGLGGTSQPTAGAKSSAVLNQSATGPALPLDAANHDWPTRTRAIAIDGSNRLDSSAAALTTANAGDERRLKHAGSIPLD
jgi:hypothetical protein